MERIMLLDADIVAFQATSANERRYDWGDGDNLAVDEDKTYERVEQIVKEHADKVKADKVVICLTDPESNFRNDIFPLYKHRRKDSVRPELLRAIKEYLAKEYPSYIRPGLEADDVMGILATHPTLLPGEKIMVSEDKDMRTIPGKIHNPNRPKVQDKRGTGIIDVSPLDANRFLCWQTIVGDPTDDYPGCPGLGKTSVYAEEVLSASAEELWDIVLDAYASKGLTEEDALVQARCARILRWYDFDYDNKRVIPWTPEALLYGF